MPSMLGLNFIYAYVAKITKQNNVDSFLFLFLFFEKETMWIREYKKTNNNVVLYLIQQKRKCGHISFSHVLFSTLNFFLHFGLFLGG